MKHRLGAALAVAALLGGVACGARDSDGDEAAPDPSPTPTTAAPAERAKYVSSTIPDNAVGGQLRWFLEAATTPPIPVADIESHFAAVFLAQVPPDQLNGLLTQPGAPTVGRFLGVLKMTETSIEADVDPGTGAPFVVAMSVDAEGKIHGLLLKPVTLPSRATRGLAPVALPEPTGRFPVGTEAVVVTDAAREGRRIPVQLWYPATTSGGAGGAAAPYAPAGTSAFLAQVLAVPADDVAAITTHATSAPALDKGGSRLPVVLFSPGFGVTRPFYSGLSAALASHGYLVAVVDHPGDGQLVEFPDGPPVEATPTAEEESLEASLPPRVSDVRAVLDELQRLDATPGGRLHQALDLGRVALAGHSLGGATAAEAMHVDPRFRAGVNLDGSLYGTVVEAGLDRPFLLVSSARPEEPQEDETWVAFRARTAAAQSLVVAGSGHMSFSDWPALSAFRPPDEPRIDGGTIDPGRSAAVQSSYVLAFLDRHLRGEQEPLLDGPSPDFPEVSFR